MRATETVKKQQSYFGLNILRCAKIKDLTHIYLLTFIYFSNYNRLTKIAIRILKRSNT